MKATVSEYYKLNPADIYDDVHHSNQEAIKVKAEGVSFCVFPHVYPSHKFRTTSFLLKNLHRLVKGKLICDMGCGPGIIGLFSLHHGAKSVVQADINPHAVENAKENNILHGFSKKQVQTFLSNCFDKVPNSKFDIIVFNIPYHSEEIPIDDPLKFAFFDPAFSSVKKFLTQAREYSHRNTKILISFSNKGNVDLLEHIFEQNGYDWKLWKVINADQEYDNRIYLLTLSVSEKHPKER